MPRLAPIFGVWWGAALRRGIGLGQEQGQNQREREGDPERERRELGYFGLRTLANSQRLIDPHAWAGNQDAAARNTNEKSQRLAPATTRSVAIRSARGPGIWAASEELFSERAPDAALPIMVGGSPSRSGDVATTIAMVDLPTDAGQDRRHRRPDPTLRHFPPGKKPWPWVGVISPQVGPSGSAIGSDDPL